MTDDLDPDPDRPTRIRPTVLDAIVAVTILILIAALVTLAVIAG